MYVFLDSDIDLFRLELGTSSNAKSYMHTNVCNSFYPTYNQGNQNPARTGSPRQPMRRNYWQGFEGGSPVQSLKVSVSRPLTVLINGNKDFYRRGFIISDISEHFINFIDFPLTAQIKLTNLSLRTI